MRVLGQTKLCILSGCTGTMRRTHVHLSEDMFDGCEGLDDEADVTADYEAWICSKCGLQQRCSNEGVGDSTVDSGAPMTVRFIAMKLSH